MSLPASGRRRSPGWRPSLLVCGLIAIALHLLLLLWPVRPREPVVAPSASASLRVLRIDAALPTAAAPEVAAEPPPVATTSAAEPTPPASAPVPAVAPQVAAVATAPAPPAAEPEWWPREQLDSGPQPRQPVLVDTARAGGGALPAGSNALLYVDEQGRVERVEFGGTPLPAQAEQALRAAFEATPFEPGQRGGRPVRSRVRIAVDLVLEPEDTAR